MKIIFRSCLLSELNLAHSINPNYSTYSYLKLLLMEVVNIKRQEKASLIFLVSTRPIGASINYVEKLKDKRNLVIEGGDLKSKMSILRRYLKNNSRKFESKL